MSNQPSFSGASKKTMPSSLRGFLQRYARRVSFIVSGVLVAVFAMATISHAGIPTYSGGGPTGGQTFVPLEALIDVNMNENVKVATATTGNITLKKCTTSSDATACSGIDSSNKCTGITVSSANIRCDHSALLETNTTYEFRVTTAVQSNSTSQGAAADFVRIFRTSSFSGSNNTVPPRLSGCFPMPGSQNVPTNAQIVCRASDGPESIFKNDSSANAINTLANLSIRKVINGVPDAATELCPGNCASDYNTSDKQFVAMLASGLFVANTEYQMCVAANVQNMQNVAMGMPFCTRFKTGASADLTAPTLRSTNPSNPANNATGVSRFKDDIAMSFNKPLRNFVGNIRTASGQGRVGLCLDTNANSICDDGGSQYMGGATPADLVELQFDVADNTGHFLILGPALAASTRYCLETVGGGSGVTDMFNNNLAATQKICFTTGNDTDSAGPKMLFAEADSFKLVARFNEPIRKLDVVDTNGDIVAANVSLQCPTGVAMSLAGKKATYNARYRELQIQGVGLPPGQNCQLVIGTGVRDLAGNAFSSDAADNTAAFQILNASSTGGFIGSGNGGDFMSTTNFATFAQNPQRCQPRTAATNKSTSVECEFPIPAALTTGAKFVLTFPTGFTVTSAAAPAGSASFMNADLNGPNPGTTTISGVAVDNAAGTVTVTLAHAGTAMGATDQVRFELSGITTPTIPSSDSRISIIVKNASGVKLGQTINAAPFQIQQAGSMEIKGAVFKDSNSNGAKDGGEGIAGVKLFCSQMGGFQVGASGNVGMMGHQEATTDGSGDYAITGLTSGQYGCNLPPQTALNNANVGGSSPFQNVTLASTSKSCVPAAGRSDCVDFKFADLGGAAAKTITINITGGPASETVDAFCFSPSNFQSSAPVMKAVSLNGSGAGSTTLKLQNNFSYDCGIGPHIAFESFGTGAPPAPPTFSFMPPKPQKVLADADKAVAFALTSTNRTITGTVVDGSSAPIANVFVHAEPAGCFNATSGVVEQCNGAFAQTKSDGTFTLNVSDGVYEVGADGPGLPPSTRATASVKGANVSSVTLKMVKSSTTISGTIKDESGNGIKYAHVSGQRITTGGTCAAFTPAGGFADSPTDSSGNYTLYAAAGTWCIRAFAPSYGEIGSTTVVVSGSTSQTGQNIAATAAEYGTITGTVTSGGTAVTSGFMNCFGTSGGNNAQIGSDGTFSLKVKAGTGYTCDGFVPGVGPITRQSSVTVTASATTALGTIALGNAGTITVTVTGISDGFCDARSSTGIGSGAPLQSGTATIKVQAGTYTVRCGSPKTGELVNQSAVVVTAGGSATVAASSTLTTRTVVGQVTDGTNNLEGVTLKFDEKSTGRSFIVTTGNQSGASTDNFSATSIPEGTYKVTASKKGYEAAATTATVSGGNLDLTSGATALALTPTTTTLGETVNIPVDDATGSADYTGGATVVATKTEAGVTKTVVGELDATTGTAPLDLTNGTWTLTAVGDNGKTTATTATITIANGAVSGATPDLDLTTNIGGKSDAQVAALLQNQSETVALSSGGLLKFEDLSVGGTAPEVNIPASALSTSDSSTGKVDMKADTTLAAIDPGADLNFVGSSGYDITPKDASGNPITDINGTVTITMPYTDADVAAAGVAESKLQFASFDTTSQTWETFPTTVDTANNLLIASISHFSSFAVIGSVSAAAATGANDSTPPSPPTNVKLVTDGAKVTLTWTDPSATDLRRVEVLRNNGVGTVIDGGNALELVDKGVERYVDTAVTPGKTYSYQLRAKDTSNNASLTAEFSIKVEAAVAAPVTPAPSSPSGGGGGAPAPAAPVVAPTPTPAAPVAAPVATPAPTVVVETKPVPAVVSVFDPSKLTALLAGVNAKRQEKTEKQQVALVQANARVAKVKLSAAAQSAAVNFVTYGISDATKKLSMADRRALLQDYLEMAGASVTDWADLDRVARGEAPTGISAARNKVLDAQALANFKKMTGRNPKADNAADAAALASMKYRLRVNRDLKKEARGVAQFKKTFKRAPSSGADWAAVRAYGYGL